jgi:cadmium resistance protein CadD (predicted permease)
MNLHGESVLGHGLILAAGFLLLVIATLLAASVVWIPAAVVVGIVGMFALAGGIWAHITNPVNVEDLADSLVKMTGAAIAITFGIAVIATIAGYAVSVVVGLLRWLAA